MSEVGAFKQLLEKWLAEKKQPQIRWAVCDSVDWDNGTMTAIGQSDDLEYYNVLLGAGSVLIKPVKDAVCLIGVIEGEESAAFLLSASEVDEVKIISNNGNIDITNGNTSLYKVMASLAKLIKNLKVLTPSGVSVGLHADTIVNLNDFETKFKNLLKDA